MKAKHYSAGTIQVAKAVDDNPELHETARSTGRTVSNNAASSMAARVLYMVSRLFVPPFVLARVGLEAYGLWTTAFILVAYLGISTLGISNVYIKFVAEYNARKEFEKANQLISTGLMLTIPICVALFALLVIFWPNAEEMLHVPSSLRGDAKETILLVVAIFLSSISLCAFSDALAGVQQIVVAQKIWVVSFMVETVLIFTLVGIGRGIRGMAEAYFIRQLLSVGLSIVSARKALPWLRVSPRLWSKQSLRLLAGYGGVVQLQSLISTFINSVERVVALPLVGVEAAGMLDLAKKWPSSMAGIPSAIITALLPAASHLKATDTAGSRNLQDLYLGSSKYLNLAFGYFAGFIAVMAIPILRVWLGKDFPGLSLLLVVFTISTQIHMLTGPGTSMMTGIGKPSESLYYCFANLAALAVLIPIGRIATGAWSVANIGTMVSVATIVSATYFIMRTNRNLKVSSSDYLANVPLGGLVPYLVAGPLVWPVSHLVTHLTRWEGLAVLVVAGVMYTVTLSLLTYRYFLNDEARESALRILEGYFKVNRSSRLIEEKI